MVWCGPLHLAFLGDVAYHASLFYKWQKKKKKKVALHILAHGAMRGCGLSSLVVCINDKFRDIRERNVTKRSEIRTTNIRSLGFRDIRE
jgi:23S rRNA maturation mini-RNase III